MRHLKGHRLRYVCVHVAEEFELWLLLILKEIENYFISSEGDILISDHEDVKTNII